MWRFSYCHTDHAPVEIFCFTCTVFPAKAVRTGLFCAVEQFHSIDTGYNISTYSPFPKYTVAFYDIDRLVVDLTDLIWIYLGKKVTDCINFRYLSMYAVFQSFSHTFRRRKNCVKTLILQHQKEQCRHDDIKQWDRSSFSFVR